MRKTISTKSTLKRQRKPLVKSTSKRRKFLTIRRRRSPEIKFLDQTYAATNVSWNGTISHLTAITQAITEVGRIGNMVEAKGLIMRASLDANSIKSVMSMYVFVDTQNTAGTVPAIGDVLQTIGAINAPLQPLERSQIGRYKLLARETTPLTTTGSPNQVVIDRYIPLDFPVRFSGANSTDIEENGIYVIWISSQDSAAATFPIVNWTNRLTFTDT